MTRITVSSCALALAILFSTTAAAQEVVPKKGTPHHSLLGGLKLILNGKFDNWMKTYCHPDDLCMTETARKSLLKYNLPALKRIGKHCIKGRGNAIKVTRTDGDPAKDDTIKLFIQCNPKGMPRPFTFKKKDGRWLWKKV